MSDFAELNRKPYEDIPRGGLYTIGDFDGSCGSILVAEMRLLTDHIRITYPSQELVIKLFLSLDLTVVTKPAWRLLLDFVKAQILVLSGRTEGALQVGLARNHSHKSHPYWEGNARLLRYDRHFTPGTNQALDLLEEREYVRL